MRVLRTFLSSVLIVAVALLPVLAAGCGNNDAPKPSEQVKSDANKQADSTAPAAKAKSKRKKAAPSGETGSGLGGGVNTPIK